MTATRTQYSIVAALIVAIFVTVFALFHFKKEADKGTVSPPQWKVNAEDINPSLAEPLKGETKVESGSLFSERNTLAQMWRDYPWAMERRIKAFDETQLLVSLESALIPPQMKQEIQSKGMVLEQTEVSPQASARIFDFAPVDQAFVLRAARSNPQVEANIGRVLMDANRDGVVVYSEVVLFAKARFKFSDKNRDGLISELDYQEAEAPSISTQ